MDKFKQLLISRVADFLKNILNIFVANYYLNLPAGGASKAGVLGVITSLIAIGQALKVI